MYSSYHNLSTYKIREMHACTLLGILLTIWLHTSVLLYIHILTKGIAIVHKYGVE